MKRKIANLLLVSSIIIGSSLTAEAKGTDESLVGLNCAEEETEELVTQYDKDLIAVVTMGEAEGESEEGKRLVIDTILNRVDSEYFPDTIEEVIYQPYQFEAMWNGRIYESYDMTGVYDLIDEELEERLNSDVIFFTAGRYGDYGTPLFQVGNHYFASY